MNSTNIVSRGRENAIKGLEPEIRCAVKAEFADRLSNAGFVRRMWLRLQMWRLIRKRVQAESKTSATRDGQYVSR